MSFVFGFLIGAAVAATVLCAAESVFEDAKGDDDDFPYIGMDDGGEW